MSDISFHGLGAFLVYFLLLAGLALVLIVSLILLVRKRINWKHNLAFGFFISSAWGVVLCAILMVITENGSLATKEFMDKWCILFAVLIIADTLIFGFWYRRRLLKKSNTSITEDQETW